MRRTTIIFAGIMFGASAVVAPVELVAQQASRVAATLAGVNEVPAVVTPGQGSFSATIHNDSVEWSLSYADLQSDVSMAHIHIGQSFASGGVMVWLCGPDGVAPAGTSVCPQSGTVEGVFTAADVVGPAAQGVSPGDFTDVVTAMRRGLAYANVHTAQSPLGEIRGQIKGGSGH